MSVPLLAGQLGRPVNLGERVPPGPLAGGPHLGGLPPLSPHHISNLLSHTLFAAIPTVIITAKQQRQPRKLSMLELGFVPNFYQFVDLL